LKLLRSVEKKSGWDFRLFLKVLLFIGLLGISCFPAIPLTTDINCRLCPCPDGDHYVPHIVGEKCYCIHKSQKDSFKEKCPHIKASGVEPEKGKPEPRVQPEPKPPEPVQDAASEVIPENNGSNEIVPEASPEVTPEITPEKFNPCPIKKKDLCHSFLLYKGIENVSIVSLLTDSKKNIYIVGNFKKELEIAGKKLTSTQEIMFAAKLSAEHKIVWIHQAKPFTGGITKRGAAVARGAVLTSTNELVITGHYWGDFVFQQENVLGRYTRSATFIMKLREGDGILSSKPILFEPVDPKLGTNAAYAIAINRNDAIYIGGYFTGKFTAGAKEHETQTAKQKYAYVMRLTKNNVINWSYVIKGKQDGSDTGSRIIRKMAISPDGNNLIVMGTFSQTLLVDKSSAGVNEFTATGNRNLFLLAFNMLKLTDGVWLRPVVGRGSMKAQALAYHAAEGAVYAAAQFDGAVALSQKNILPSRGKGDIIVVKYSPSDKQSPLKWFRHMGGPGDDNFAGFAFGAKGKTVYLAGSYEGRFQYDVNKTDSIDSKGEKDSFLLEVSPSNKITSKIWITGSLSEVVQGISVGADSALRAYGAFHSKDALFGDIPQKALGKMDAFIWKIFRP